MLVDYFQDREEALKRLNGRPIGPASALRYVRLAHPDTTEEERRSLLWDEVMQKRIGWHVGADAIALVAPPGPGDKFSARVQVREEVFWREALFSEADVAAAFPTPQPRTRTKATIPVAELTAELRRRAASGILAPNWSPEAAALSRWAADALPPGTPCSHSAIRGHPLLQTEYNKLKLGGQK